MQNPEERVQEQPCRFCRAYNRVERTFCVRCRRRIIPLTAYDITEKDFIYQPDKDNLEVLQGTEPLPHIIEQMVSKPREKSLRSKLAKEARKVTPSSMLGAMIVHCGEVLALEMLPDAYIVPMPQVNAAVFGQDDSPVLMITAGALRLNDAETLALIGHELGHVKSKHMLYHTLAESLGKGTQLLASFAGAGLVSLPIQMLLLAWHRESEVSADRAALLVVDDPNVFRSLMVKLSGPASLQESTDPLMESLQTHPSHGNRWTMIKEFYASDQFKRAREKVGTRSRMSKAFVPFCRFCGAAKPITGLYCETCGKSQL
jgi:hypothetical protein